MAYAPESQRAIAAWATQKALLSSLAIREWGFAAFAPSLGHPLAVRASWRRVAAPRHPGLAGRGRGSAWNERCADRVDQHRLGAALAASPRFYFVTVSAGYLVLQVGGQDTDAAGSPVTFVRPDNLLTTVLSIWPARDQLITWPPGTILTKDELTELGEWEGTQSEAVRPRGHLRHE